MRYVYLPNNLTALQLLDFRECSPIHQQAFQHILTDKIDQGDLDGALLALDLLIGDGTQVQLDGYTRSLALVLKAEVFRRQGRWYEAVTLIHYALNIMEFQISLVTKYNEGIAVYTEGLCHLCMQSQAKAADSFSYAQPLLQKSERYWHTLKIPQREYECNDLVRFITELQQAGKTIAAGTPAVFMPVYELRDGRFVRTDAVALQPYQYALRLDVTATPVSNVILLNPEGIAFLTLSLTATYVALRITEEGDDTRIEAPGDLMILEILPEGSPGYTDAKPVNVRVTSRSLGFVTTQDGRVIYDAQTLRLPGCEWLVSPHLLIRKEALL